MAATSFFKNTGINTFGSAAAATGTQTRYYLGSAASAPITDLDGNPLSTGMLYANSTNDKLYRYTGIAWTVVSDGLQNLVEDTSPQLGADLQSNGSDIVMADDDKVIIGTDSDTLIQHTSAQNKTYVQSDGLEVRNKAGGNLTVGVSPGATKSVSLYHSGSEKLAVRAGGVLVTGGMTSDSATVAGISYPSADGTAGQAMTTDGSGTLTFADAGGASVGSAIAFAIAL